jgi:hypothetical protein
VSRAWLAAVACLALGCSRADPGRELIPAEWTVAEDTSETGDVTTVSLQLPSARDIGGLLEDEPARLILRCVDGRVEASIDAQPSAGSAGDPAADRIQVQLDSAPACE